jgi:hypothetical protein
VFGTSSGRKVATSRLSMAQLAPRQIRTVCGRSLEQATVASKAPTMTLPRIIILRSSCNLVMRMDNSGVFQ